MARSTLQQSQLETLVAEGKVDTQALALAPDTIHQYEH